MGGDEQESDDNWFNFSIFLIFSLFLSSFSFFLFSFSFLHWTMQWQLVMSKIEIIIGLVFPYFSLSFNFHLYFRPFPFHFPFFHFHFPIENALLGGNEWARELYRESEIIIGLIFPAPETLCPLLHPSSSLSKVLPLGQSNSCTSATWSLYLSKIHHDETI